MFQVLDRIDRALRERLDRVATRAAQSGDTGIVQWAIRADDDALALGRVRDRDVKALERLEGTYNDEFYSGGYSAFSA